MNSNPGTSPKPARSTFGERFEWLLLLAALMVVVVVYPLRLQESWMTPLIQWWRQSSTLGRLTQAQLEPFLSFLLSPLVLKGALAGLLLIVFSAVRIARMVLQPEPLTPRKGQGSWAWLSILAFMVWALASFFWSPTPDIALMASYWVLAYGVFLFLLFRRGFSAEEARRLGVMLMLLGVIVMGVLFLQALPVFRGVIFKFMMRFDDARNVYGSLLGHNTAAAAFLMLTAFPALAFLLTARHRTWRVASALYLAAFLLSAVLLQSRSVWALAPVLAFFALRSATKAIPTARRALRVISVLLMLALTLALLSQTIDRPWNPLFVRENALATRLQGIAKNGIAGESRVRLNIINATLVAQAPLIGHGLESFAYVYPERQGEFFTTHPDTPLNRSTRRSDMAHNEYMQVAVDQGLIGLGLMLWFMGEVWRRGRTIDASIPAGDALLHRMFGWSAFGFALHAGFDFPIHVPQIALPGFFCMAAWAAWRPADPNAVEDVTIEEPAPASVFRFEAFVRLLTAMLVIGLIPLAALPFARMLQADAIFNRGQGLLQGYYQDRQRINAELQQKVLDQAAKDLESSLLMQPENAMAALRLAECYMLQGVLASGAVFEMERQTQQIAPTERQHALGLLQRAIAITKIADRNMVFHELEMLRARIYQAMRRLDPRGGYGELYRRSLDITLHLLPHHPDAAYLLAEDLAAQPNPDLQRILALRKLAYAADPMMFFTRYIETANNLVVEQRYAAAADLLPQVLQVKQDEPLWIGQTAIAQALAGRPERALEYFGQLKQLDPALYESAFCGTMDTSLLTGQWQAALDDMHARLTWVTDPEFVAILRVYEQECRRRLGLADQETAFPAPPGISPEAWEIKIAEARPLALRTRFRDARAACDAVRERLDLPDTPSPAFWIEAVYCALAANQLDLAGQYLEFAAEADPKHPALNALRQMIEASAR